MQGLYTEHNNLVCSLNNQILPAIREPRDFDHKISQMKDSLRCCNGIPGEQLNLIILFFGDLLDYIYKNRRKIREKINGKFSIDNELFSFMKRTNSEIYQGFKELLAKYLKHIADKVHPTESKFKELVAEFIITFLYHYFIEL
jgi:hypothetical protein